MHQWSWNNFFEVCSKSYCYTLNSWRVAEMVWHVIYHCGSWKHFFQRIPSYMHLLLQTRKGESFDISHDIFWIRFLKKEIINIKWESLCSITKVKKTFLFHSLRVMAVRCMLLLCRTQYHHLPHGETASMTSVSRNLIWDTLSFDDWYGGVLRYHNGRVSFFFYW